jgi:hypothetical protein
VRQPEYLAGEYDTTYLDRLLASRRDSFNELDAADEDVAAIAAALDAFLRAGAAAAGPSGAAPGGMWKQRARAEALRG